MTRLFKIFFLTIAIPTLMAIALVWAVLTFIPQERIRRCAADSIGKEIHRQLVIGPVHLRWNGIVIDTLKVSEVPSFKAGSLLEADGVHLGWHLRSIWEGLNFRSRTITQTSGTFLIEEFRNPHYTAKDFSVDWSLRRMDSSTRHLTGWAKLKQGPGTLQNMDRLIKKSKSTQAALTPVLALMNLERSGVLKVGLPDLRHWPLDGIQGDYTFTNGLMTIRQFEIRSQTLNMSTTGTVELESGKLALHTEVHTPKTTRNGALDAKLDISGTTSNPVVDLSSLKKKVFQASVRDLLNDPKKAKDHLNDAVKNLFH